MKPSTSFGISVPSQCGGRFGVEYPTFEQLADWVTTAEKMGFESYWHIDRLLGAAPPAYNLSWYDPLTTLASLLSHIKRGKVGTSIINITYRNPLLLAKQLATLDNLSNGRLLIGVGQGWCKAEFEALDIDMRNKTLRFEEAIAVLTRLLSEDEVTFQGRFWNLNRVRLEPRCVQKPRPPILLGGGGNHIHFYKPIDRSNVNERVFRRVAKMGDGWIARTDTDPEEIAADVNLLRRFLPEYNKDLEKFPVVHQNFVFVLGKSGTESDAKEHFRKLVEKPFDTISKSYLVGRPREIKTKIRKEFESGVNIFIPMPVDFDYELLHFFGEEIIPMYRV